MEDQRIKEILIEKNEEFRRLFLQHQEYEEKLELLLHKKIKTDQEHIEAQKLKKQKLLLKDAMQEKICAFRERIR